MAGCWPPAESRGSAGSTEGPTAALRPGTHPHPHPQLAPLDWPSGLLAARSGDMQANKQQPGDQEGAQKGTLTSGGTCKKNYDTCQGLDICHGLVEGGGVPCLSSDDRPLHHFRSEVCGYLGGEGNPCSRLLNLDVSLCLLRVTPHVRHI